MKTIEIYDPALCCSSGACGPSPDQAMAEFSSAVERIKAGGATVKRFNLAQEPLAFVENRAVQSVLEEQGEDCLPLVFVDGALHFRGVYPSYEQLAQVAAVPTSGFVKVQAPSATRSNCCEPQSGCC